MPKDKIIASNVRTHLANLDKIIKRTLEDDNYSNDDYISLGNIAMLHQMNLGSIVAEASRNIDIYIDDSEISDMQVEAAENFINLYNDMQNGDVNIAQVIQDSRNNIATIIDHLKNEDTNPSMLSIITNMLRFCCILFFSYSSIHSETSGQYELVGAFDKNHYGDDDGLV